MSQNLSVLLSNNDITYNALQNSLANAQLQDTDKVTLTANGLERDDRVRHFVSLGSWKTTNQAIVQQTKDWPQHCRMF